MNHLLDLRKLFEEGSITKADYIEKIHSIHQYLFEYADFIKKTDIEKIEIIDDKIIFTTRKMNIKYFCDPLDKRMVPIETLNLRQYEEKELNILLKLMKSSKTVVDIGGNVGWFAMNVAKMYPDKNVYTFEPVPKTYNYLLKNLNLNHINSIHTYNIAISDSNKDLIFYYYNECLANASTENVSNVDNAEKIICKTKTLDSFVKDENIKIDFIKCDIEGAELFAFKGAINILKNDKPIIFSEILRKWSAKYNYHPNDIIVFFAGLGYSCYVIRDEYLMRFAKVNENTIDTNYIFLHNNNHSDLIVQFCKEGL